MSEALAGTAPTRDIQAMRDAPDWRTDGADWPNRAASRFVEAAGLRWHVQVMGQGPVVLLLHGTGAATHSWRDLAPLLARDFTVVAPDLPGHGFTEMPPGRMLSLNGMARGVAGLAKVLAVRPALVVGHSAGAAVAARMALNGYLAPQALVSLNGAFLPMQGWAGPLFSPIAKLFAQTSLTARLFARNARDRRAVQRLLDGTGSRLDARGVELYARLARTPRHAGAALGMMARWDLKPLLRDLPRLRRDMVLVVGDTDASVPPKDSARVAAMVPGARLVTLEGLGHLAHEEDPAAVAGILADTARAHALLPAA